MISSGKQRLASFILAASAIIIAAVLAMSHTPRSGRSAGISEDLCGFSGTAYHKFDNAYKPGSSRPPTTSKFLVADKQIRDPMFMQTVIFLLTFDERGAAGVIINRPTNVKLSAVLPDIKGLQQRSDAVFIGGPVDTGSLLMLIRTDKPEEGSQRLFGNVYISGSISIIKRMLDDPHGGERFRIYAGYAGWGAGQLENEISRGDWHVIDAAAEFIFDKDASSIWPELISIRPTLQVNNLFQKRQPQIQRGTEKA